MRQFIAIIICISFVCTAYSQPIAVSALMDSTKLLIGDQTKLHLKVTHAPNIQVQQANFSAFSKLEDIEIVNMPSVWDTLEMGNQFVIQKDLTIQAFDSGMYIIPQIPITYIQNGRPGTIKTRTIPIEVSIVQRDSVYLAPIKEIEEEELSWRDAMPFLLTLLGLAFLIGLAYFFYKRKKNEKLPPPPEVIIPAHEIALSSLSKLKQKELWQQGLVKEYQSELTYIVREYLENRYDVQALESTTDEIVRDLHTTGVDQEHRKNLQDMFMMADMVKFAKAKPPVDAHERLMQQAEQFIQKTKKIELVIDEDKLDKKLNG